MAAVQGKIQSVQIDVTGAELDEDVSAGATTLHLNDISDFSDEGGLVSIDGGDPISYLTVTETDDGSVDVEGVDNPPVFTMELAAPLAAGYVTGVRVDLSPRSTEMTALVLITGNDDEAVECRVPNSIAIGLDTGVREQGVNDESVLVDSGDDGRMEIVALIGDETTVQTQYFSEPPGAVTDTVPPAVSPAATVTGGVGSLFVSWLPVSNVDPVTYEIHIGTVTGFVPDSTTLAGESKGGSMFVAHSLPLDGTDLAYNTTYYVQIVAKDDDGPAAPGTEASGSPRQIDTPDIVIGSIIADLLAANSVSADKLEAVLALVSELWVGDKISITPSDGIRITLNNGGYIHFPADGSAAELIKVIARFTQAIFEDNVQILGVNNRVGGSLTLDANIPPPSEAPTVTSVFDQAPLTVPAGYSGLGDTGTKWRRAKIATTAFSLSAPPPNYTLTVADFDKTTGATTTAWTYVSDHYATAWAVNSFHHSAAYDVLVLWWNGNTTNAFNYGSGSDEHYEIVVHNNTTGATNVYQWSSFAPPYYRPAVFTDGTYIYVGASVKSDAHLVVIRYSMTLTGGITQVTTAPYTARNMTGLYVGNADFGSLRYVMTFSGALPGASSVAVHDGASFTAENWAGPASESINGIIWDGTRFYTSTTSNKVRKFSTLKTSPSRNVKYTWHNIAGNIESTPSPSTVVTQTIRQWLLVATDTIPTSSDVQSPDSVRIYIDNHKQTDLVASDTSELYEIPGTAGGGSPGVDGFALISTYGLLQSEGIDAAGKPVIDLRGTGDGRLGPLSWNKNGKNVDLEQAGSVGGTYSPSGAVTSVATSIADLVFTAPKSGRVMLMLSAYLKANTAGSQTTFSPEVRAGNVIRAGAVVHAADPSSDGIANYNTQYIKGWAMAIIDGLTPGADYNAYGVATTSSATGAVFTLGKSKVVPLP